MFESDNFIYLHKRGDLYNSIFYGVDKSTLRSRRDLNYHGAVKAFAEATALCSMNGVGMKGSFELPYSKYVLLRKKYEKCIDEFQYQVKPMVLETYPSENHYILLFPNGNAEGTHKGVLIEDPDNTMSYYLWNTEGNLQGENFKKVLSNVGGVVIDKSELCTEQVHIPTIADNSGSRYVLDGLSMDYIDFCKSKAEFDVEIANVMTIELYISRDNKSCILNLTFHRMNPRILNGILDCARGKGLLELTEFEEMMYIL